MKLQIGKDVLKFLTIRNVLILLFLLYGCLSLFFAFERILCIDNSYFFYQIVNSKTFCFPENRFGIALSQIPLLMGVKAGLSLSAIIYIYSISFVVEYALIAYICYRWLQVKEAALTIGLCLIMGVAHSFFHPVTETYHAMVVSCLAYAFMISPVTQRFPKPVYYGCLLLIVIWALVSHPVGVFTIAFVGIFAGMRKLIPVWKVGMILILIVVVSVLRIQLATATSYDSQQYSTLFAQLKNPFGFLYLYPVRFMVIRSVTLYLPFLLLCCGILWMTYLQKSWKLLMTVIVLACGYGLLGVLTFANGDADIMMEKTFLPGVMMVLLLFSTLLYQTEIRYQISFCALMLFAVLLAFFQINQTKRAYSKRLNILTGLLREQQSPKVIANYSDFDNDDLKLNHWNTGIDALILAKCRLNQSKTIFLTDDKTEYAADTSDLYLFLGPTWWAKRNSNEMDSAYFYIPPAPYLFYEHKY